MVSLFQEIPKFTRYKENGNKLYRQWQKSTQKDRDDLLHQTLQCYKSAERYASTDDERASINKNIGCTYFELANRERSSKYMDTAIDSFTKAITNGKAAGKSPQWQNQLNEMLSSARYFCKYTSYETLP